MNMMLEDFKGFYFRLPPLTRYLLTVVFGVSLLTTLGMVRFDQLHLEFELLKRLQVWRLLTAFVTIGKLQFNTLIEMFMLYFAYSRVEDLFSRRNYHDLLWMVVLLWAVCALGCLFFEVAFCSGSLFTAVLYVWGKRRPAEEIHLYFVITVKSGYLCWVLLLIRGLTGGFVECLIGIAAGHLYIVFKDLLPLQNGKDYMATPEWFKRLLAGYTGHGDREFRPQAAQP